MNPEYISELSRTIFKYSFTWKQIKTLESAGISIYQYKGIIQLDLGIYAYVSLLKVGEKGMWIISLDCRTTHDPEDAEDSMISSLSLRSALVNFYERLLRG